MYTPVLFVQQTELEKKIKIGEQHSTDTEIWVRIDTTHACTHARSPSCCDFRFQKVRSREIIRKDCGRWLWRRNDTLACWQTDRQNERQDWTKATLIFRTSFPFLLQTDVRNGSHWQSDLHNGGGFGLTHLNLMTFAGDRIKLHSELCTLRYAQWALHYWYLPPHIMRARWAGHVACMVVKRNAYRVLVGKPGGNRQLGRHPRRWEDNIKMYKYDGSSRTGFVRLRTGTSERVLWKGNELAGCIKCEEFLGHLRSYQLLKKDSASWYQS